MQDNLTVRELGGTAVCDAGRGSAAISGNDVNVDVGSADAPVAADAMQFKRCVGDVDRIIGKRVRERRIMLGLNQQQLAEIVGVTYQQEHKYEKGINRIAASRLFQIASALNVGVAWFFETLEREDDSSPPEAHRMMLDLARSFAALPSQRHRTALCELARAMAQDGSDDEAALSA